MQRAGWYKIDPYREDIPEDQRPIDPPEPPVFGTVKFTVLGQTYLFDQVRGPLRHALELHIAEGNRTDPAQYLASLLQQDNWDDYAFFRCRSKLQEILEQIKPV